MTELAAPPHDVAAERAVLAASLNSGPAYRAAREVLTDEDWYRPAHAAVWRLMRAVAESGTNVDPVTVNSALATADEQTRRLVSSVMIGDLYGAVTVPAAVRSYAVKVAECGMRRRIIEAAHGAIQRAHELDDAGAAAEWAVTEMALARDTQVTADATDVDVHALLGERLDDSWVIPGLLGSGDRLIITASEGLGKSTMLRQVAVCAAAGIHPFHPARRIDPVKVLVVDCENGRMLSQTRYRPLVLNAERHGHPVERDMLRIDLRPSGLDLANSGDAAMLLRMVERTQPDLMLIGPIYRLHEGDPNDERLARKISVVLDHARAASGCALITEAHTPHSDGPGGHLLRPYGSSLWKRWPEFGYCLKLAADSDLQARMCRLVPWRGPRDERDWPVGLRAGGEWPWTPISPEVMRYAS